MHKLIVLVLACIGSALAKPGLIAPVPAPLFAAPVPVPAPIVTAASSQVIARQYNGIAAAPIFAAPAPAPLVAPVPVQYPFAAPVPVAAPLIARPAFSRVVGPAPYAVAPGPFAPARYAAAYPAPLAYSAPLAAW